MQKGDIVLIRTSRGEPGVRRIWDDQPERPFVCHEEYWARWERHGIEPVCWPVSREQIYRFEEGLAHELEEAFRVSTAGDTEAAARLEQLWRQAQPFPVR